MTMTRIDIYHVRKKAFSDAAEHLRRTALDLDQMAARFPGRENAAERRILTDKAELLRGQAEQLRKKL